MTGRTEMPGSQALSEYRRRKDAHFAGGRGPIQGDALEGFTGLSYYPFAPALVFQLLLERSGGSEVELQTSTGEVRTFQEFATVHVPFPEGGADLTLYAEPGEAHPSGLFLPFRDAGSGTESYGAGRYLDAPTFERDGALWVSLDFNLAYHPYCAYSDRWTCPLPPPQNWLKTVVRAGERLP